MIFAIVEDGTGLVVNRCDVESRDELPVQEGRTAVEETGAPMWIGGTYLNGVYTPPVEKSGPVPQMRPSTPVLHDHENRLRAIEGLPPLSLQDFVTKTGLDS